VAGAELKPCASALCALQQGSLQKGSLQQDSLMQASPRGWRAALGRFLQAMIAGYQRSVSPLFGDCCRFEPSCSHYTALCLKHHGPLKGSWLGLLRLLRCNALFRGGLDLPPLPAHVDASQLPIDWQRVDVWVSRCMGIPSVAPLASQPRPSALPPRSQPDCTRAVPLSPQP
jgi:uncharacterized protein